MTVAQRIQWIAAPRLAMRDGSLDVLLSVVVAPRLRTDEEPVLATFPDVAAWPSTLLGIQFSVEAGGEELPAERVSQEPDGELWNALLPPDTPVRPFTFDDYADRPFVTYGVREVLRTLRRTYTRVAAAAPDDLPPLHSRRDVEPPAVGLDDLLSDLRGVTRGVLHRGVASDADLDGRVGALLDVARAAAETRRSPGVPRGGPLIEPLPPDGSASRHLERALLFHRRRGGPPVEMPPDGSHYVEALDFHQLVSALGDHPWLLERLGLVLTLRVANLPQATPSAPGFLTVRPVWDSALGGASVDVAPPTAYVFRIDGIAGANNSFSAAPRVPNPLMPDAPPTGLLDLPEAAFAVQQVDVDGGALKAIGLAITAETAATRPAQDSSLDAPASAGVPALRTSGIALVETGRAAGVQAMFGRQVELNEAVEQGVPAPLFAEDLVRGLRLDVLDDTTRVWRSLHHRRLRAAAERLGGELEEVVDEGFFELSLAERAVAPDQPPDPHGELYLHESLITWDGWSLSVPRPGRSLSRDARAPTEDAPETLPDRTPNDPFNAMGLRIETDLVAGTLPRLRFGRGYRLRVRTVDVAGNGPSPEEADRALADQATGTPALPAADVAPYLRFEPVPPPVLVPAQHFGEGASLQRLVVRSNGDTATAYAEAFDAAGEGHPGYRPHDDRHVAAPKAAFDLVERHGLFDPVVGSTGEPPDPTRQAEIRAAYAIAIREKGSFDDPSLPGAEVVTITEAQSRSDGTAEDPQRYVVHTAEQLELPYLPDPLATGALLFGLPGMPSGEPLRVSFGSEGPWYEAAPFRLRLTDGAGEPEWDEDVRLLTVRLPAASSARIRICSVLGGDLGQMGIIRWCEEELADDERGRVLRAAEENRLWLMTPWTEVELVHAVQQPLGDPVWETFELSRDEGEPLADVFAEVRIDLPSTERVDLAASWTETVDDLAQLGPAVRDVQDAVLGLSIAVAAAQPPDGEPRETPFSIVDEQILRLNTRVARGLGLPDPTAHIFGDTRHRQVTYRMTATTPFREDFPAPWIDRPALLTRTSAPMPMDVPSSAPPAMPHVLYAVPTLGWELGGGVNGETVRRRRGGGIRVYLDRPWFSSGDGELLGVVVGGGLASPLGTNYPYMTLLGQDPARAGAPVRFPDERDTFPTAVRVVPNVRARETGETFSLACFEPRYDTGTSTWFCDINLDTGDAYLPIVRLALARYQPSSLPGCHLSRIVLVDLLQPLPDRTLTVARDAGDGGGLRISVTGPAYSAIRGAGPVRADDAALGRMTARIEERDPEIPDNLLGWRPVDGTEVALTRTAAGDIATWSTTLPVPAGDGTPRRLVVIEEDHLAADGGIAAEGGLAGRVVYADALEL